MRWHPILRFAVPAICGVVAIAIAMASFHGAHAGRASTFYTFIVKEPPYVPNIDSVGFDISPVVAAQPHSEWIATYNSQGKTAKFRILLQSGNSMGGSGTQGLEIQSGKGMLIAEPGSDPSILLLDLKKALQAKVLPKKVKRVASLAFDFASFGNKQSRIPDGGFSGKPPGNWTPMKLFIGEGDQESEVFLNLNPVLGKGEFSIKDEDYGNSVLAALATVL